MASSYGQPAHLFCGSLRLLSHTGVQQGDNMGPAGFCFATQDLWESFSDLAGVLWQAWYMDDGTIVGNMAALSQVVTAIQTQVRPLGPRHGSGKLEPIPRLAGHLGGPVPPRVGPTGPGCAG